jgi:hypothetical protein
MEPMRLKEREYKIHCKEILSTVKKVFAAKGFFLIECSSTDKKEEIDR